MGLGSIILSEVTQSWKGECYTSSCVDLRLNFLDVFVYIRVRINRRWAARMNRRELWGRGKRKIIILM